MKKGDSLTDGAYDINNLFDIAGKEAAQNYILNEASKVYSMQGASINDKHLEVIARQMFSRYKIKDPGSSDFNKGEVIAKSELDEENKKIKEKGGDEIKAMPLVKRISEVALSTPSLLSAASFQNTVKVLVRGAIEGAEDKLLGLKENVIIGRIIPAGTGFRKDFSKKEETEEPEEE